MSLQKRVLFVDDDANALAAFQRTLRGTLFEVETALGAHHGLQALSSRPPFAVVVSDMRMPVMNGIQFLQRVRELAPDTIRMMLTGNADLQTAVDAVNEGCIFQFLFKPCPMHTLKKTLNLGVQQYYLVRGERELLEKTLHGCAKVLTDVLGLVNPIAFSRATRIAETVRQLAKNSAWGETWKFELAGLLSQVGCVTLTPETLEAVHAGTPLNEAEQQRFDGHPFIARDLIIHVPRLEEVAEMIARQREPYKPADAAHGEPPTDIITAGARMLRLALDLDAMTSAGVSYEDAIARLRGTDGLYDPGLLCALKDLEVDDDEAEVVRVDVIELSLDMVLQEDVRTSSGLLLVAKGQAITTALLQRLRNFTRINAIDGKVSVRIPATTGDEDANLVN